MRKLIGTAGLLWAIAAPCAADPPTFSGEVVRIFQQHCQTCHHPGDIGPFSLMDYESAGPYAQRIKEQVVLRKMPPWKPVRGFGDFLGVRVLSEQEIAIILQWVDAGAPEGDPSELPPPLTFPDGWVLGEPDLVLSMEEFSVPAGEDLYRCFSLPTQLGEDRHVRAIEIRPGNRSIVHHVLLFGDPSGLSQALDSAEPGQGYTCFGGPGFIPENSFFGGFAPGVRPLVLDAGTGLLLQRGSRVVIQVHYHPEEGGATDLTRVGIHFTRAPVDKIVRIFPLLNTSFRIPAGHARYEVKYSLTVPPGFGLDSHIVSIAPHMHTLGREILVETTYPDSRVVPLIWIDDWDFEWQGIYTYRQPVPFPEGSRVEFTAYYDNSANNPENPNSPPKDVTWGEATTDEMALVFLAFTLDSEHLAPPQISSEGVVNAASFQGGALAPGGIVSLFGTGLTSAWETASTLPLPHSLAGGTKLSIDGIEVPMFYASPSQINFQVPFEISRSVATLTITRGDDQATRSVEIRLVGAQPGIFTLSSDGKGPAAALHADSGLLVSAASPADAGEWVSLYATGLGQVSPPVVSGEPSQFATTPRPPVVTVGDSQAEVNYSGLAPGFVGLYQINLQVPSNVSSGEQPVQIIMDGAPSNIATLAVR